MFDPDDAEVVESPITRYFDTGYDSSYNEDGSTKLQIGAPNWFYLNADADAFCPNDGPSISV